MDAPTLVYLLAVVAYSIYNWWKKSNKDSKKPQNSAPKTEKAEVPEWMKEIFGDALGEEKPARPASTPTPVPVPQAQTKSEKPQPLTTREPLSRSLEVKPLAKKANKPVVQTAPKVVVADKRSLETLESIEDVYATKTTHIEKRQQVEAADALVKPASNDFLPESTDDWRRAIILQTVLERHESLR
ncbi:MAG: hypothetical protein C0424_00855 [Sphingobacteriaceae bacterium]|nr:hypothetical protein [Sphingobacteriaceae bacterium]